MRDTQRKRPLLLVSMLIASMLVFTAGSALAADSITDLTEGITAGNLATQLAAGDVTVDPASVNFTGDNRAAGSFAGGAGLGLDGGVVLGTGRVKDIVVGEGGGLSTSLGRPGDAALSAIVGTSTFDATVLEFDFEVGAGSDEVFFSYVFGSREYPFFVGSQFNDVFAFWVNDVNCAVTETGEPIALNNVATAADIAAGTWIDNQSGTYSTRMPGFTVPLLCQAAVSAGTNTIRLAIADASDSILDSWVLIQAGSLSTVNPTDTTPPSCQVDALLAGPPAQLRVRTQDLGSGIASIQVTRQTNLTVDIAPFTPGTTDPVMVTGTKIDNAKKAQLVLMVTDVAGNQTVCDPVHTLEIRATGKPLTNVYDEIPEEEGTITIDNNTPGLQRLDVEVNGTVWKVTGLKDGQSRTLDVSSAMQPGDDNVVKLTAHGRPGGAADVWIWDGIN
jgi:hypothetical protein